MATRLRVCADCHRADRQRRRRLHDRGHEVHLVAELPALRRGQLGDEVDLVAAVMEAPASFRPERRWCHTPPTTPSTSSTGWFPAWPAGVSARFAAAPGYSRSRGWPATTYAS